MSLATFAYRILQCLVQAMPIWKVLRRNCLIWRTLFRMRALRVSTVLRCMIFSACDAANLSCWSKGAMDVLHGYCFVLHDSSHAGQTDIGKISLQQNTLQSLVCSTISASSNIDAERQSLILCFTFDFLFFWTQHIRELKQKKILLFSVPRLKTPWRLPT